MQTACFQASFALAHGEGHFLTFVLRKAHRTFRQQSTDPHHRTRASSTLHLEERWNSWRVRCLSALPLRILSYKLPFAAHVIGCCGVHLGSLWQRTDFPDTVPQVLRLVGSWVFGLLRLLKRMTALQKESGVCFLKDFPLEHLLLSSEE